ncbi:hypothetical protein CsatA_003669 [Cannabis sativa]
MEEVFWDYWCKPASRFALPQKPASRFWQESRALRFLNFCPFQCLGWVFPHFQS